MGFSVQDFLEAITSQLDRTQDAMRLKAINRPLTYAIKDFSMELKAVVDMGADGEVKLRPTSGSEQGASVLKIGFTTITRPMIEENTVSLSQTKSPGLDELGFNPEEKQRLERVGVRNAAELKRLQQNTGKEGIARLTRIPLEKVQQRLDKLEPRINRVGPVRPSPTDRLRQKMRQSGGKGSSPRRSPASRVPKRLKPKFLELEGNNLWNEEGAPKVLLEGTELSLHSGDSAKIVYKLPEEAKDGLLEVTLPGQNPQSYDFRLFEDQEENSEPDNNQASEIEDFYEDEFDPWMPKEDMS